MIIFAKSTDEMNDEHECGTAKKAVERRLGAAAAAGS
jgi:hypothetical protein